MRLTAKFVIAFVLTAIIPIVILGYMSYYFAKLSLKEQVLEGLVLTAEAVEGHLYSFMENIKGRAVDFSSDGFIRDSAKALQRYQAKNHPYEKTQRALNAHLKRNKKPLDKSIRMICVIGLNGRVIASTDEERIGADESKSEYFSNGIKDVFISDVYRSVSSTNPIPSHNYHIAVSAPLKDKTTGTILGVIVNFYETSELNKVLSGKFQIEHGALSSMTDRRKTLDIYLVNAEKLLITPSRSGGEVMKQKVETLPVIEGAAGRETKGRYRNCLGSEVIGASMIIPSKGWTLLVEVGVNEIYFKIMVMKNRIILSVIPIGILAVCFAYFLFRESRASVLAEKSRLEALVYGIRDGIIFTNAEDNVALINSAAEEVLAMKAADCVGQPIHCCLRDTMKTLVKIPAIFREEKLKYHASEITYKGRYFEITASPIRRSGVYVGTVMVLHDSTERKQKERLLVAEHAVVQALAESATLEEASSKILQVICEGLGWDLGGVWTVDSQNNVLQCVEIWRLPWLKVSEFEAITRKITFSPGVGLPGRVWASGKPAWIIDVAADANLPRAFFAAKEGLHGAFCFP
ncbi:MAG: Blue-light-activated protein, partial [Candidatus Brocadiaceae bacterium]|nr:Blue-light-activated protein [Candidatus Brocadiaceae bacterium]